MARTARQETVKKPGESLLDRDGMISTKELAEFLDVPLGTLDQWASRGGGPKFHVIGNHRKYLPANVKAWIDSREREISSGARRGAA